MMFNDFSLETFILAGGKSSRMGQDKGLTIFKDKALIAHMIDKSMALGLNTSIISNQIGYEKFGLSLYKDVIEHSGPLGGLFTAISYSKSSHVLVLPCDMPNLSVENLKELTSKIFNKEAYISSMHNRINPLVGVYSCLLLNKIQDKIQYNELKMLDFVSSLNHQIIEFQSINENEFANINTQIDLRYAQD
ncbi:MAG: molybdenum cofactor guanylyltransferase [Cytophagales bacterium]